MGDSKAVPRVVADSLAAAANNGDEARQPDIPVVPRLIPMTGVAIATVPAGNKTDLAEKEPIVDDSMLRELQDPMPDSVIEPSVPKAPDVAPIPPASESA